MVIAKVKPDIVSVEEVIARIKPDIVSGQALIAEVQVLIVSIWAGIVVTQAVIVWVEELIAALKAGIVTEYMILDSGYSILYSLSTLNTEHFVPIQGDEEFRRLWRRNDGGGAVVAVYSLCIQYSVFSWEMNTWQTWSL